VPEVRLLPGREFPMDEEARAKFRSRWRELLEGDPTRSRIYKDMGAGIATAGIEYYLPLFFDETATVFDYLGDEATVVLHGDLEPAFQRFWQDTKDRYRLVQGDPDHPALPPETLFPLMASISDELYRDGHLERFRSINRSFLIALDGTDFFSSEKISCPCCTQTTLKNGKTLNRHIAVTPVLVAPGQTAVVALPPQFVQPQDGHDKQDCELAASARWLGQWGKHYAVWGITYLGDDLYCHQPHCERVLAQHAHFLFTCKPESHATLYEWITDFSRNDSISTVVKTRRTGKKLFTDTWRYVNQVPLRNSDDALMVNWCELVTQDADGKVLFSNAWATSHDITNNNVARTRFV
jgi:hypothetical protein